MFKKLVIMVAAALVSNTAFADHHEGHKADGDFKVSGDLAASYLMQGNKYQSNTGIVNNNDIISNIDLAQLIISKSVSNSNFVLGVGYGYVPQTINPATNLNTLNMLVASYSYKHESGLGFKVGKFVTAYGMENYNPRVNMNYTRSYGFALKNPLDTGLGVTYNHEMFDAGVYVLNSLNNATSGALGAPEDNRNKSFLVDFVVKPVEGLKVKLNYAGGNEGSAASFSTQTMYNVLALYNLNDMLDLGVNYGARSNDVAGTKTDSTSIAGYVGYKMDDFNAALRYEQYTVKTTADAKISSVTLTGKYNFDTAATALVEYRMDKGDANSFKDDTGALTKDSDSWLYLGVLYNF